MALRMSGQCLCGTVRFSARPDTTMHACHCSLCRRFSGGVFLVADCGQTVAIEEGENSLTWYSSSDWAERGFCARCGASLFWRGKADGRIFASIQSFEDPEDFQFRTEIFIDSKPANYAFANHTTQVTEAEFLASLAGGEGAKA